MMMGAGKDAARFYVRVVFCRAFSRAGLPIGGAPRRGAAGMADANPAHAHSRTPGAGIIPGCRKLFNAVPFPYSRRWQRAAAEHSCVELCACV
jgi:hypothetical protein